MRQPPVNDRVVVTRDDFQQLFVSLDRHGFQVVGPTVRESAIVYDRLSSVDDLPVGYTDEQEGAAIASRNVLTKHCLAMQSARIRGRNSFILPCCVYGPPIARSRAFK